MNFEVLIPITLFICVTYAIKVVVEARTRAKLIAGNGSEELIRTMVQAEAHMPSMMTVSPDAGAVPNVTVMPASRPSPVTV